MMIDKFVQSKKSPVSLQNCGILKIMLRKYPGDHIVYYCADARAETP
jgi:hypothetical protein